MKRLLLVLVSMVWLSAAGQTFSIGRIELLDQKVVIHFDLMDSVAGRSYTLRVYSSVDNFINPLTQLTGDVGLEVKPGKDKKIIWNPAEFGSEYEGSVSLEIRGRVFIPFVRFSGLEEYRIFKRGKGYDLTWSGGTQQNVLNFDLYKGDKKVTTFPNIANVGHYKMTLPKDIKPGKDYRLRVSDTKNKDEVVTTGTFAVKRKTPLLLKLLPVAVVGVILTQIDWKQDPKEIPDPIDP